MTESIYQKQRNEAREAIVKSLQEGRYVHLSGVAEEVCCQIVEAGGLVITSTLDDGLIYFCIPRSETDK